MVKVIEAMQGLKFGCDPELFVMDPDGEFVCADGLIPGTKEHPHPVEHGAVQVDGMAAEFNIDPVTNYKDFRRNVLAVRRQLAEMLPNGYKLVTTPSVVFTDKVWDSSPDEAKVLGCSPDFNAWTGCPNPPPKPPVKTLRTASGHLHVGWLDNDANIGDPLYIKSACDLVKQLDWYLGAWSTRIDSDNTRRSLYGKAGAMRFKPYGVEYRVLSNFWLENEYRMLNTWNRMQKAIWNMREGFLPELSSAGENLLLISSINECGDSAWLKTVYKFPIVSINHY